MYRTCQRDKYRNWKLGTGSAECREHSNPVIFLESDFEFPELGPPPPRGAEGLESRSTIFANISQLSSPGLQFLPIYRNSRVQVYNFCQYITTLESRSTIFANISQLSSPGLQFLPIYHNSRVQVYNYLAIYHNSFFPSLGLQFFWSLLCHDCIFSFVTSKIWKPDLLWFRSTTFYLKPFFITIRKGV
jgi:hypothetical protein